MWLRAPHLLAAAFKAACVCAFAAFVRAASQLLHSDRAKQGACCMVPDPLTACLKPDPPPPNSSPRTSEERRLENADADRAELNAAREQLSAQATALRAASVKQQALVLDLRVARSQVRPLRLAHRSAHERNHSLLPLTPALPADSQDSERSADREQRRRAGAAAAVS